MAFAWATGRTPLTVAVPMAGLSAFGPALAALALRRRSRARADASPPRLGIAHRAAACVALLFVPAAFHVAALALVRLFGGPASAWLHPPSTPEALAALVVFPLGEEPGWRGFAHARSARAFGPVRGALVVGLAWGVWHLAYAVTPTAHGFDPGQLALTVVELVPYAVLFAWAFERSGRSLAIAIAFHAGAHLDHAEAALDVGLAFHVCHVALVTVAAMFAARALRRMADGHIPRGIFSRST